MGRGAPNLLGVLEPLRRARQFQRLPICSCNYQIPNWAHHGLLANMPPTTTFHSLPEAVLARILDLAQPSVDLLLVCKLWHRLALEHGLAHWHTMYLCGASPQTMLAAGIQGAVAALLRGFDRLAPHVRRLCIDARDRGGPLGVQPVLPQLLLAARRRGAHLEQLELDTGEARQELLRTTLEVGPRYAAL